MDAVVDTGIREATMRNHTATHLLQAGLREVLGKHVKQAGSLVAPNHLRFDFSHYAAVDPSEIADIEQQVNEEIIRNAEIQTDLMNIDAALASGALAFFGDKYPERNVRVVTIPDAEYARGFYSKELCGGTHVGRSGEIGVFKIIAEQSSAAGVRRIDAITGDGALAEYQKSLATLRKIAAMLNSGEDEVLAAVERQALQVRQLEKQLADAKRKSAVSGVDGLLVCAGNDARTALIAEVLWGSARGRRNVVLLTLGTGVGGAALVDGVIVRGASGAARRTPTTPGAPTGSMLDRFGTPWRRRHDDES